MSASRPGLRIEHDHELSYAVSQLRKLHGLQGVVVVSFYADRVGVDSSGQDDAIGNIMHRLADAILAAIDDGQFDPEKLMVS